MQEPSVSSWPFHGCVVHSVYWCYSVWLVWVSCWPVARLCHEDGRIIVLIWTYAHNSCTAHSPMKNIHHAMVFTPYLCAGRYWLGSSFCWCRLIWFLTLGCIQDDFRTSYRPLCVYNRAPHSFSYAMILNNAFVCNEFERCAIIVSSIYNTPLPHMQSQFCLCTWSCHMVCKRPSLYTPYLISYVPFLISYRLSLYHIHAFSLYHIYIYNLTPPFWL